MRKRWLIAAMTSLALIGAGVLVRVDHKNRQLAKRAAEYRTLAEQGDAKSQLRLGSMYYYGTGVTKDYAAAVQWYRKSAEQGNASAQYSLAYMYHQGIGTTRDDSEAARWDRKAAEQNDPRAQDALGLLYFRGEGVTQDYADAARWYRKSAEQGNGDALYTLGYMYYYGCGMPPDRVEAERLFNQAAAQGNPEARRTPGLGTSRSAISKFMIPVKFLASLYFLLAFVKGRQSRGDRPYTSAILLISSSLLVCSFVMDLFWYSYIGHLQSPTTFTALYLARHFVGGVICALLFSMVLPNSAKAVLIGSIALFFGFVVLRVVLCELRRTPITLRVLCFAGLPLGMAMTSAILLWLNRTSASEMQNDTPTLPAVAK